MSDSNRTIIDDERERHARPAPRPARLTTDELRELREAAEGAMEAEPTARSWHAEHYAHGWAVISRDEHGQCVDAVVDETAADGPDARHIATADPSTVLRLVEEVERLRRSTSSGDGDH